MARPAGPPLILAGRHPVREALRARAREVEELLVDREGRGAVAELVALARQAGVRVAPVPRRVLAAVAGTPHHQGVVARVAARPYASLEEVLTIPGVRREPGLFLVLDQVQDPGNLGNLCRTAEALGAHAVILPRHGSAGLTPHAVKAAAGALEHLAVARVGNLARGLAVLREAGYGVVGATAADPGAPPPWDLPLRGPVALVLGSEGRGLRPLVARGCEVLTRIPLAGRVTSLNVAAAGAALLYEVRRQRVGPGSGRSPGEANDPPGTSAGGGGHGRRKGRGGRAKFLVDVRPLGS